MSRNKQTNKPRLSIAPKEGISCKDHPESQSLHAQLLANELVALLNRLPAHAQRIPHGEQVKRMPAPLGHRQAARDPARPQLPDRALAHRERQPVVVVAVRDERRGRVVALADLPQRADGLHLRGRGWG